MGNTPPLAQSYTCNRAGLTLEGHRYDVGDPIPAEVVARIRRASALLSRRWIIPDPDTHGKTPAGAPQPTAMPTERRRAHLFG